MKVRLVPPCDELIRDSECLLLYPDELIRLSGVGTAITELARGSVSVSAISAELEDRFGKPEATSAKRATQSVVEELIERGVLEIV